MFEIDNAVLEKINVFSRKPLSAQEVFAFSVVLCDNDTDRDCERFSIPALKRLSELFVGKTGIFDHNPKGANQTARIFDTELVTDASKITSGNEPYTCLKAYAYMVRTDSNADLIREIDGGIKKEVSVSCSVEKRICSICGKDMNTSACSHKKGRSYGGQRCVVILDEATDAYEWSFVAVPAQKNAGVTKRFGESGDEVVISKGELDSLKSALLEKNALAEKICDELKSDIVRLSFMLHPELSVKTLLRIAEGMSVDELFEMRGELVKASSKAFSPQTAPESSLKNQHSVSEFMLTK